MTDTLDLDLRPVIAQQPDPVVFATVSGAHLYGFPSRDSDVDLRGAAPTCCRPPPSSDCANRTRPAPGRGCGTASRWTWSPTTCASSSA